MNPIVARVSFALRRLLRAGRVQTARSMGSGDSEDVRYPEEDEIIVTNKEVLEYTKGRRVEVYGVRNREAITETLRKVRELQGDIFDKAVELPVGLIKTHPFEYGNRRTAFAVTSLFLSLNGRQPPDLPNEKILTWMRKNLYTREEIKQWLMGYRIKEFGKRRENDPEGRVHEGP